MGSVQIGNADAVASQGRLSYEKDEGARLKLKKKPLEVPRYPAVSGYGPRLTIFHP